MWEAPGTPPFSKTTGRANVSLLETKEAVQHCRKWIEDCTGVIYEERDVRKLLQDGVVLCRLVQHISPGLIKKINSGKTPFAHRENLGFFLSACQKLGLKGGQLFDLEDLQEVSSARSSASESKIGRDEQERRLRNVAVTLYWLGRTVRNLKDYHGPQLDLSAFGGFVSPARPLPQAKRQTEVKSTPPVSSIKVTSRKVSSGSSSRRLEVPRNNSVELLISPSPSETRLSEFPFCSPSSSGESLNCTSQQVPSAASPAESSEPKGLSLDLSKQLFTQTVIVGVKSPVRSQSFDTFQSVVAQSAEEDLSPTSADLSDKADLSASLDGRVLQAITEEEEKATKNKVQTSVDLLNTSSPLESKKKASEIIEEAIAEQDSFQPLTSASPEILSSLEGDTPTSITEEPSLDSCVPDQTPDERSMSGRRRMIIKPSAYGPRKQQELPTPTTSEGSDSTTGVISPAEDASMPQAAKEGAGVVPPKPHPVPEAAFWDMVLTVQLQAKETKFGFRLSDVAGAGGLFPIESITPGSPASRTDMRPSDLLLKVNSSSAEGLGYKQVTTLVKKASGKKAMLVTLRRYRKGDPQTQSQGACPVVSQLAVVPSDVTAQDNASSEYDPNQDPPGIVEVETGTMPELQHAQKVIYPVPSKGSGDDVFNDDIIPITNPSGTTSLFGGEARAMSMGSIGSEEEDASEKPHQESESLMDSVMKQTEHQTTTLEKPSPPPASTGKQAEVETPATPMQRYLDAKRLKDREIRRQQIDEGAKVYQNVQRNGRKWSKTDSLPNSRFRRNNSEDQLQGESSVTMPRARAYTSVSSLDEVSDLPSEKVKEKDERVVDILKRLSISFRPLPAFEDDGYTARKEAPADALPTIPQAIHTGSDSESGPPDGSMAEGEEKAVKQLRGEEEGLAMKQPIEREGETKKQHPAQGEGKEAEQQLAVEKKLSYGERSKPVC